VIEFKNKFGLFFENSRVKFNERQTNEVANALARVATCITCSNIFLLMYPHVNTYKIFLDGQETNESHLVKSSIAEVGEAFGLLRMHDSQLEGVDLVLDLTI
jgi:hypothetical protein